MSTFDLERAVNYNESRDALTAEQTAVVAAGFQRSEGLTADGMLGPASRRRIREILGRDTHPRQTLEGWVWPMPRSWEGRPLQVSSRFSKDGSGPNKSRYTHLGVDLMYRRRIRGRVKHPHYTKRFWCPDGVPLLNVGAGRVVTAEWRNDRWIVVVHHGEVEEVGLLMTWNSHAKELHVEVGQRVVAGQAIGIVGDTGTNITHCHHGWLVGRGTWKGRSIDPEPYLETMRKLPVDSIQVVA